MLKTSKSYSLLNRKQTRQFNNALKAKRLRISKGILKKNTAARKVSRLNSLVKKLNTSA